MKRPPQGGLFAVALWNLKGGLVVSPGTSLFKVMGRHPRSTSMQVRSSLLTGFVWAGMIVAPAIATAQTSVVAPLPPSRPGSTSLDPAASLNEADATLRRVERRKEAQIASPRSDREVPMPRPVPSIMAPSRP